MCATFYVIVFVDSDDAKIHRPAISHSRILVIYYCIIDPPGFLPRTDDFLKDPFEEARHVHLGNMKCFHGVGWLGPNLSHATPRKAEKYV